MTNGLVVGGYRGVRPEKLTGGPFPVSEALVVALLGHALEAPRPPAERGTVLGYDLGGVPAP